MGRNVGRVSYVSILSPVSLPLLSLDVTVPCWSMVCVSRAMNRFRYTLVRVARLACLCDK